MKTESIQKIKIDQFLHGDVSNNDTSNCPFRIRLDRHSEFRVSVVMASSEHCREGVRVMSEKYCIRFWFRMSYFRTTIFYPSYWYTIFSLQFYFSFSSATFLMHSASFSKVVPDPSTWFPLKMDTMRDVLTSIDLMKMVLIIQKMACNVSIYYFRGT